MKITSNKTRKTTAKTRPLLIRKCHVCGQLVESEQEQEKCCQCGKAFLPLNYFEKIHGDPDQKFQDLFSFSDEIDEDSLILGIYVVW